jgi:hypothetical protein
VARVSSGTLWFLDSIFIYYRYCAEKGKDPVARAYDLESLKDFVHKLAYGIEGKYDDETAGQGSVKVIWKRFTAGFKRDHDAIPRHITLSVTNVEHPLPYVSPFLLFLLSFITHPRPMRLRLVALSV